MGRKGDLSDIKRGMLLVTEGFVWLFQKLLIYWNFHKQLSLGFTENGLKKRKYPVSGSSVGKNGSHWCQRSEENGQTGLSWEKGNSNSNNHSYKLSMYYVEEHLWTHNFEAAEDHTGSTPVI